MKKILIAPSVLAADFSRIKEALDLIKNNGGDWVHLDIMDGHFVPNMTFGPKMVSDLRPCSSLIFDVHMMIENPEFFIEDFAKAGADYITFHAEAAVHMHRLITQIKDLGKKAGISIVPSTPVNILEEVLEDLDLVLIMTVNPGFGGQKLITKCLDKIKVLDTIRKEKNYKYLISVDGGINDKNAGTAAEMGADVLDIGSAFFKDPSWISDLKKNRAL